MSGPGDAAGRPGTLYVLATPIGHLGDLSPRAAEVLRSVKAVAAEDTRRTAQLFAHLGVGAPTLISLPAFDERGRLEPIVDRLRAGQSIGLCTDAGTPGVSDPGVALVAAAWEAGALIVPIPGPSAGLTALMASGLPADQFFFAGFLPRKGGARAERMAFLRGLPSTLVIYEAGNRTAATLHDLAEALGDRTAVVGRELTKLHEELARGSLRALAARFSGEVRGEVTLVVAGADEAPPRLVEEPLDDELRRRLEAGEPPSVTAREVARARGLKRAEVYQALERLKRQRGPVG
jgi:16S rRNA (cytidine1402-2'-O)-methyltransferase